MLNLLRLLWLLFLAETVPDAPDDPDDETADDEEEGEPEKIHDPEKMALSQEAGKWRKKLRAAEARIKELEEADTSGPLRETKLENAFLRAVMERGDTLDMETAWDLLHVRGFMDTVKADDGQVSGMPEALDLLLDRYPWLTDEVPESEEDDPDRPRRSAMPPKKRKAGAGIGPSKSDLQDRFPSLRKRG